MAARSSIRIVQSVGLTWRRKTKHCAPESLTASLKGLHEGSVARYRLKRPEFIAWQSIRDAS